MIRKECEVGDLVKIVEANEPYWSEDNVGELAIITYKISDEEVEVQILYKNGGSEPWIYRNEHLEMLNESNTQ